MGSIQIIGIILIIIVFFVGLVALFKIDKSSEIWSEVQEWADKIKAIILYILCLRFLVTLAEWLYKIIENIVESVVLLIRGAGKGAESLFVLGTCYIIILLIASPLLIKGLGKDIIDTLNYITMIVFAALPELILLDAAHTSYERFQFARQSKQKTDWFWFWLAALPTVFFAGMLVFTIVNFSVVYKQITTTSDVLVMPWGLLLLRVLPSWLYAVGNGLYRRIGSKNYTNFVDQLRTEMDTLNVRLGGTIEELKTELEKALTENKTLFAQVNNSGNSLLNLREERTKMLAEMEQKRFLLEAKERELDQQKALLEDYKNQNATLQKAVLESAEDALQGYSEECKSWLNSGIKTVSLEDIIRFTGHSKRKIENAISKGTLKLSPRNDKLILMTSLIEWLKVNQPLTGRTEELPSLHIVNG